MKKADLKMVDYPLFWITDNLVVSRAPMSYDELGGLKEQGIDAIVNLCGEFSDLHELEEQAGFEVFWIPIPDETAPSMDEMEKGLEWLDEAVYLGKKVLVHCRHGIGRTGTFVTAYLLRRGFSLNKAGKMLKSTRATPTNFSQWWLLRKFGKKEGQLSLQEPTPENRKNDDLEPFFLRYELLLESLRSRFPECSECTTPPACSHCDGEINLYLIEALYLHTKINVFLSIDQRNNLIDQFSRPQKTFSTGDKQAINNTTTASEVTCPLYRDVACLLHQFRPVSCRLHDHDVTAVEKTIQAELENLSKEIFSAVFDVSSNTSLPQVQLTDVVSGRFIQKYFQFLAAQKNTGNT
ncbi:protein-tyrosine phosphatase family protein [Desulfosediminicola sp.]|uniref:protein-tyrosine phosphatase family protein n=1 Tax=Desulfosediminicola sp. TaxID=2886825 RepID=UPI003AF2E62E